MADPQKEDGHIDIANEIGEALCQINLSAYENRIVWTIFRKTYGWHKKWDRITFSQFQEITSLDRRHIGRTIRKLVKRNIIACRGNGQNIEYCFQKDFDLWDGIALPKEALPNEIRPLPNEGGALPLEGKLLPKEATEALPKEAHTKEKKENTKETRQKKGLILPEWINKETWDAFLEMRKKKRAIPTEKAKELLVKELEKLRNEGNDPNEVLNQSIMRNYTGVFPLKGGQDGAHKRSFRQLIPRDDYSDPDART